MSSTPANRVPSLDEAAAFSPQQVVELVGSLNREVESLKLYRLGLSGHGFAAQAAIFMACA